MTITANIMYVREIGLDARRLIKPKIYGNGLLVETLTILLSNIGIASRDFPELLPTMNSINQWLQYINTKYSQVQPVNSVGLDAQDGTVLFDAASQWLSALLSTFNRDETVFISQEDIYKLFTTEIFDKLDKTGKEDLVDGITCILNALPTPAAMILLRLAEGMARKYLNKVTGIQSSKMTLGQIIIELGKKDDKITGYLSYLKQRRDEAEHPDKRFTQEEAETILIHTKTLFEQIKKEI